ncbi:MAG: hypothetical protein IJ443_06445 [Firmicutes bacterium]|nr:hypothetical protein [Bacillota bacterium]
MEEVVEQWCQEQFFGAGEIVAAQSFEEGGIQYMDVTLSRTAESGEHYEACIYMKQEKPWKWVSVGHHYGHEPLEHTARYLLAEADPVNIFDEFNMAEYSSVELLTDASGAVESAVVSVHFRSETGSEGNPSSDVKFYANLKTGEAELVSPG